MIPFFVGYALLIWFGSAKHRRSLIGLGVVASGVGGLVVISYAHWLMGEYYPELMIQGLQILMYPYIAVVGAVGLFIASMPRPAPVGACRGCHYDLQGIDTSITKCPECGHKIDTEALVWHRPSGTPRENLRVGDPGVALAGSAADRAGGGAADEDQPRDHAQEHPADAGELGGRERFDGGDRPRIGARSNQFILARQPRD